MALALWIALGGVLATSGIDVAVAAMVVAAGFTTLTTSVFALNVHLGLSAALAVLVALGFELLVLPRPPGDGGALWRLGAAFGSNR